jgi:YidC/Oxa1 family membrane protein insertase
VLPQPAPGLGVTGTGAPNKALAAVLRFLPYITVLIAAFAPLAAVVYLVTSTGWSAAERLVFAARTGRGTAENA